jgi:hypothetical protein
LDGAWTRRLPGHTVCPRKHKTPLKAAGKPTQRLEASPEAPLRPVRGRRIRTTVAVLAPKLPGWGTDVRHAQARGCLGSPAAGSAAIRARSSGGNRGARAEMPMRPDRSRERARVPHAPARRSRKSSSIPPA